MCAAPFWDPMPVLLRATARYPGWRATGRRGPSAMETQGRSGALTVAEHRRRYGSAPVPWRREETTMRGTSGRKFRAWAQPIHTPHP